MGSLGQSTQYPTLPKRVKYFKQDNSYNVLDASKERFEEGYDTNYSIVRTASGGYVGRGVGHLNYAYDIRYKGHSLLDRQFGTLKEAKAELIRRFGGK